MQAIMALKQAIAAKERELNALTSALEVLEPTSAPPRATTKQKNKKGRTPVYLPVNPAEGSKQRMIMDAIREYGSDTYSSVSLCKDLPQVNPATISSLISRLIAHKCIRHVDYHEHTTSNGNVRLVRSYATVKLPQ